MPIELLFEDNEPLKLSCDTTDCSHGLHCFGTSRNKAKAKARAARPNHGPGKCQECGDDLVDWGRVKRHDLADVKNTFAELQKEWIRHHFFHEPIDQHATNYALRKGRAGLRIIALKRVRSALQVDHPREGRQTSWNKDILCYAQHATACCCRHCLEYWHGMPLDHPLSDQEFQYFADLCLYYVFERMPDLPEQGRTVPPIRKTASKK